LTLVSSLIEANLVIFSFCNFSSSISLAFIYCSNSSFSLIIFYFSEISSFTITVFSAAKAIDLLLSANIFEATAFDSCLALSAVAAAADSAFAFAAA